MTTKLGAKLAMAMALVGCVVTGCREEDPVADGGTSGDAGGGAVAECERLAAELADRCEGSDVRPCMWDSYGALCATGNTALLTASMRCLDAPECRAFTDPNEGEACLRAAHEAGQSSAARAAIAELCRGCGGTACDATISHVEILPYLSDADLAAFESCRGQACSLLEVATACAALPGVAPFAACFE